MPLRCGSWLVIGCALAACGTSTLPREHEPQADTYVLESIDTHPLPQPLNGDTIYGAFIVLNPDSTFVFQTDAVPEVGARDTTETDGTWSVVGGVPGLEFVDLVTTEGARAQVVRRETSLQWGPSLFRLQ